jgi:hypothetical protein
MAPAERWLEGQVEHWDVLDVQDARGFLLYLVTYYTSLERAKTWPMFI